MVWLVLRRQRLSLIALVTRKSDALGRGFIPSPLSPASHDGMTTHEVESYTIAGGFLTGPPAFVFFFSFLFYGSERTLSND